MAIIRANNNTLSSVTALPFAITTGGLVKIASTTVASGSDATEGFVFAKCFYFYLYKLQNLLQHKKKRVQQMLIMVDCYLDLEVVVV